MKPLSRARLTIIRSGTSGTSDLGGLIVLRLHAVPQEAGLPCRLAVWLRGLLVGVKGGGKGGGEGGASESQVSQGRDCGTTPYWCRR